MMSKSAKGKLSYDIDTTFLNCCKTPGIYTKKITSKTTKVLGPVDTWQEERGD